MHEPTTLTIDLHFQNKTGTIGAYLLPYNYGGILVETGPTSTLPQLIEGLKQFGFSPSHITDILLTHIHLDHAGAAGWFAQQGTRVHVHPKGVQHLINPEKLLASATRVYGDQMDTLWGIFFPVPESQINPLQDNSEIKIGNMMIRALDVPGHAVHHLAYLIDGTCFTGDIGGVRVHNQKYISIPTPPPDLNIEQWRESIHRLIKQNPKQIVPTHFGVYPDAEWHFTTLLSLLDTIDEWINKTMLKIQSIEELREEYLSFEVSRSCQAGLQELTFDAQQTANPYLMSADGIFRYWNKYRKEQNE